MKTNQTEEALTALLRKALWDTPLPDATPRDADSLMRVLAMAERQSVLPLVCAAMGDLLPDDGSEQAERLEDVCVRAKFAAYRTNGHVNEVVGRIVPALRAEGIEPLLLKGQGVAQVYPEPMLRTPGDIDLLLGTANVDKAIERLKPLYEHEEFDNGHPKHFNMKLDGIEIELHRMAIDRSKFDGDGRVAAWLEQQRLAAAPDRVVIGDCEVSVPPVNFNVVFVFYHLVFHYYHGGVGLRQFCDWMLLLHRHHAQLDLNAVGDLLRRAGLMRDWLVFGGLLVRYLGLPPEELPFYQGRHARASRELLSLVLQFGNFGTHLKADFESGIPRSWLAHRLYTMRYYTRVNMRRIWVSPRRGMEAMLRFYRSGIKDNWHRLFG